MFSRPSQRKKSKNEEINLPLVPILDAMVTLIGFLLFGMAFTALTYVETPFPQTTAEQAQEKIKEPPLQLTISVRDKETEVWSPFEKIKPTVIPHVEGGKPDLKGIHEALIEVKKQFPNDNQAVIAPNGSMNYDQLVALMDSIRLVEKSDPPVFRKNPQTGTDEPIKQLFADVVFGNLLGGE